MHNMAVVVCCVPGCSSRKDYIAKELSTLSYHSIPVKPNVRELWLQRLQERSIITKKPFKLADSSVVCSLHFIPSDYKFNTKKRKLQPTAVPNVFPCVPPAFDDELTPKRRKYNENRRSQAGETSKSDRTTKTSTPEASSSSTSRQYQTRIMIDQSEPVKEEFSCNKKHRSLGIQVSSLKTGHLEELKTENVKLRTKSTKLHEQLISLKTQIESSELQIKKLNNFLKIKSIKETDKSTKAKILIDQVINFGKQNPNWDLETLQECNKWRTAHRKSYDYARKSGLCTLPSRSTLLRFCKEKKYRLFNKANTLHTVFITESPITTQVGTFITVQNVTSAVKTKTINIPSSKNIPCDMQSYIEISINDVPKSPSQPLEHLVPTDKVS